MRILHLITRLILGGAQENTVLSCEGQAERGHEVTLAHGPIFGPEGSLLDRARRGGYGLRELSGFVRPLRPWTDYRGYRQCRTLIRELKPDIVHTHSSKAGILGRAAARAEGVPAVVHTIHGLPFHPYQPRLLHDGYVLAERWAARRCHRIVCVADAMSRQALAEGVGQPEQYATVYSAMEIEPFTQGPDDRAETRRTLGISDEELVIGTVARLAELKGHDDLLDALGDWLTHRPNVRLLWVGDGWWRDRLQQRIEEAGLRDRIVITGLVDPSRVPAMIRAMDVLVHPSYREGLARTLPQAMLTGVPVVSYDGDGAPEVCQDGVTGRLVPTGDHAALLEAVQWMADNPQRRAEMGAEGRRLCEQRFAPATMINQLDSIYRSILDRPATPATSAEPLPPTEQETG